MDKRTIIFKKARGKCSHCGKEIKKGTFTIDHFIPKSYFGTYCIQNLFPLCRKCNEDRGNKIVNAKDFYSYDSGSHMSVVYTVSYEEYDGEVVECCIKEIPVEILISKSNTIYRGLIHREYTNINIAIYPRQSDKAILQINASVSSDDENYRLQIRETK